MKSDLTSTSTRRAWIRSAGVMALAVATPGWLVAGPATTPGVLPPRPGALDTIDLAVAQSLVGTRFEIVSAEGHAMCELASASGVERIQQKTQKTFSMEFRPITRQGHLLQDTYLVQHPALGTFDLFLVPHTNGRGETLLVATFSRL